MGLQLSAYKLQPWQGVEPLRPSEVATRLLGAFDNVTVDFVIARHFLQELIRQPRRLDLFEQLRTHGLAVDIADDFYAVHYVHMKVYPNMPLYIGINSDAHDEAIQPLVFKIADTLGYTVQALRNERGGETQGSVR